MNSLGVYIYTFECDESLVALESSTEAPAHSAWKLCKLNEFPNMFSKKLSKITVDILLFLNMAVADMALYCYIISTGIGILVNAFYSYQVLKSKLPRNPLLITMILSDVLVSTITCPFKTYRILYEPNIQTLTGVIGLDLVEVSICFEFLITLCLPKEYCTKVI